MIEQLINVIAPVFIAIAVGWTWAKMGRPYETQLISSLVMDIGAPCLVFSTLSSLTIPFHLLMQMGGAALAVIVLSAAAGTVVLRLSGFPLRAFLPPIVFANIGNMGLPLCYLAFGKEGLALAIVVFAVFSVSQFTIGVWIYSGAATAGNLLKMPVIYAVLGSLLVLAGGLKPPEWLHTTADMLGSITIPMMLLTLGVSLAQLKVTDMKRATALSALRLVIGFGASLLVASALDLPGSGRGVLILQSTMPVAVFNYLLSERYDRHPNETAGMVVISTMFALVMLPLLLHFLSHPAPP